MRLTVYSDYALRLLMYLAVQTDKLTTIPEVAKAYSISANHLMKVVHQMGQAGYESRNVMPPAVPEGYPFSS